MADATITKHVDETLIIGFRFHSPELESGESIISAQVSAQAGITAGTVDVTTPEVSAPVSGGTAGTDYTVRFKASTDQGQVFVKDYLVKVIA